MLFTSYQFIWFLIVVFLLFYCVPGRMQTTILLLAGYCFYLLADDGYLIYILITTVVTFFCAKKISQIRQEKMNRKKPQYFEKNNAQQKTEGKSKEKCSVDSCRIKKKARGKSWLVLCLCINLGLLCLFKYTNFSIYNINTLLDFFGSAKRLEYIGLLLPLGISFYTFQSVGYLIDVYRGKYAAEENIIRFALFVSFFPQLVQGPISRYDELGKSLFTVKRFDKQRVCFGLQRILWGYFKKLVIADRILAAVHTIIHSPEQYQGAYVLIGALFYAVELYADFTGGIDITIGIGELFGVQIAENFRRPFFSKSVKEYWNRWHISMGTWFRDYLFYPVSVSEPMKKISSFAKKRFGKKIGKKLPVYLSSLIVWFFTGLWHGAGWNFIAWGLGNFLLILISEECKPWFEWFHKRFPRLKAMRCFSAFQMIRTIFLMSCLRMFDCYKSVPETVKMFGSMFSKWDGTVFFDGSLLTLGLTVADYAILLGGIGLMVLVSILQEREPVRQKIRGLSPVVRFCIWYGLFLCVLMLGAYGIGYDETQFIYKQF